MVSVADPVMLLASNPAPLAAIVVTVFDSATTRTVNAPVAVADSATADAPGHQLYRGMKVLHQHGDHRE